MKRMTKQDHLSSCLAFYHSQPSGITINTDHSSEISQGWLLQCKPPFVFSVDLCIQLPLSTVVFSSACTHTNCSVWNCGIQNTDGTLQVVVTHLQKQAIIVLVKNLKRHTSVKSYENMIKNCRTDTKFEEVTM